MVDGSCRLVAAIYRWDVGRIGAVFLGLAGAVVTVFLAIFCSGSGEGWNTPLFFSLAAFLAFPLTFYGLSTNSKMTLALVALSGIILDAAVYWWTIKEGVHYFEKAGAFAWLWVWCWLSWQAAAVFGLVFPSFFRPKAGAADK